MNFLKNLSVILVGLIFIASVAHADAKDEFAIFDCKVTEIFQNKVLKGIKKDSVVKLVKNRNTGFMRATIGDNEYSESNRDRITTRGAFGANDSVTILPINSNLDIEIIKRGSKDNREILVTDDQGSAATLVAKLTCH